MIRRYGNFNPPKRIVTNEIKRKDGRKGMKLETIASTLGLIVISLFFGGMYLIEKVHTIPKEYVRRSPIKPPLMSSQEQISTKNAETQTHFDLLSKIQKQFNDRYKMQNVISGPDLLKKGLHSFGSIEHTARRILQAAEEKRPFVMGFSGYSITVGRGNFFNQSFPFVAGRILEEPMKEIFGIPVVVRNAAIGGIPSFPYGFCLDHFLGTDPDVVSWDYSMNEGGKDASVLEAFVRQAMTQLPKKPMLIMVDTNANRMRMLDSYTSKGWLDDAIAIGKKDILNEKAIFGEKSNPTPEGKLPAGFQKWNEFGSPSKCPGRGPWHPKKQEHTMMGWFIAMHFIKAMEEAIRLRDKGVTLTSLNQRETHSDEATSFGPPISQKLPDNDPEVTELLFGHHNDVHHSHDHLDHKTNEKDALIMKHLSCRTSFLPATDHSKTLPSIVVSGLAEGDLDIMVDRTDEHYKEGWVLDVSTVERQTKRKVENCGGLGYIDMKIALYGIPESGKIRLWLPFDGPSHDHHNHDGADTNAKHWFDDFIVCEANDKRDEKACKLDRDLELIVGGVEVASEKIHPLKGAAEYLKRQTCVNVGVPKDAVVTPLGEVRTTEGKLLSQDEKAKFGAYGDDTLGMVVDVTAKAPVTRQNGACCLSHIVWEQH